MRVYLEGTHVLLQGLSYTRSFLLSIRSWLLMHCHLRRTMLRLSTYRGQPKRPNAAAWLPDLLEGLAIDCMVCSRIN